MTYLIVGLIALGCAVVSMMLVGLAFYRMGFDHGKTHILDQLPLEKRERIQDNLVRMGYSVESDPPANPKVKEKGGVH